MVMVVAVPFLRLLLPDLPASNWSGLHTTCCHVSSPNTWQRVRGGGSCGPPAWYRVRSPLLVWLSCVAHHSARLARVCCALVIVARERCLIVSHAAFIYKKGTERSKTAPKSVMTMHADLALRAACGAAGCGRPHVANFDARDGYGASMWTSTTTAGENAMPRLFTWT